MKYQLSLLGFVLGGSTLLGGWARNCMFPHRLWHSYQQFRYESIVHVCMLLQWWCCTKIFSNDAALPWERQSAAVSNHCLCTRLEWSGVCCPSSVCSGQWWVTIFFMELGESLVFISMAGINCKPLTDKLTFLQVCLFWTNVFASARDLYSDEPQHFSALWHNVLACKIEEYQSIAFVYKCQMAKKSKSPISLYRYHYVGWSCTTACHTEKHIFCVNIDQAFLCHNIWDLDLSFPPTPSYQQKLNFIYGGI